MCDRSDCETEYGSECDCEYKYRVVESWLVIKNDNVKIEFPEFDGAVEYAQVEQKKDVLNDPDLEVIVENSNKFRIGNIVIYRGDD